MRPYLSRLQAFAEKRITCFAAEAVAAICVFWLFWPAACAWAQSAKRIKPDGAAVVEFFLSENSPSLKDALNSVNAIEQQHAQGAPIYVLAFHVDYLNTTRWKDEFGTLSYTERQKQYAAQFHEKGLYANEAVINGQYAAHADKLSDIRVRIWRALSAPVKAKLSVNEKLSSENTLSLEVAVRGLEKMRRDFFYLHAALIEDNVESRITDGINSGNILLYTNLVRAFQTSRFDGRSGEATIDLPFAAGVNLKNCRIICFVQDPQNTKIIGATDKKLKSIKDH